jgi:hypothetical protein
LMLLLIVSYSRYLTKLFSLPFTYFYFIAHLQYALFLLSCR